MAYKMITLDKVPEVLKTTSDYKQVIDAITRKGWFKPNKWELDDFVVYINENGDFKKVADTHIVQYDLIG